MNHTKTEYDLRWSGRVGDFCSTDGSSRAKAWKGLMTNTNCILHDDRAV
jgi:hypothetical protein